jgi:hypothetical protein
MRDTPLVGGAHDAVKLWQVLERLRLMSGVHMAMTRRKRMRTVHWLTPRAGGGLAKGGFGPCLVNRLFLFSPFIFLVFYFYAQI